MSRFLRFLGIQAGEGPVAAGLFSYSLLLGVGRVFVLTASQALFLEFYPASHLAYVYMIAAVATIATSAAYLRMGRRLSIEKLILVNLLFTLGVTAGLRVLLGATGSGWPAMALAAWFHVVFALTSFAFWGAATQVVDIRQGKRLFPIATTGDVVAFSLGGFFILRNVDRLGTANLLWIGAAGFGLAIAALSFTLSRRSREPVERERAAKPRAHSPEVRWSSPYLRLMMAYFVLSAVVFVLLDNAFNDVAQRRFEGAAELARFFATYSAVAAIVNFLFRSLLAGRLVRRFGLVVGLAILPAIVGLGAAVVAGSGTLLPGVGLVFWLTTATRLSDKVLRGVQQSSMATLFQPLMDRGPAVQTAMDGIVDSAAIGLTGAALLALHSLLDIGAVQLAFLLVACCLAWVVVAVLLKREFVDVLGGVLHRRRLRGGQIDLADNEVFAMVRRRLESPHPEDVAYALGLLAAAGDPELPALLGGPLEHASEDVRREALRYVASLRATEHRGRALQILRDPSQSVELRGAAARALGPLSDAIPSELIAALEDPAEPLRRGAMVGLLCSGSIEGIVYAGAALLDDLGSERPEARASGAEILRDAAIPSFFRQIRTLLGDPDARVRARAIEAAAAVDHPDLWPLVVDRLTEPDLASVASRALIGAGAESVPFIVAGFERHSDDLAFRIAAIRILGLVGGDSVVRALHPLIGTPSHQERTAVLTAIAHSAVSVTAEQATGLAARLDAELDEAAERFAAIGDLAGEPGGEAVAAVREALEDEIEAARHRIFLILSILRPEGDLVTAWENYASGVGDRRAYALELLDSHLSTSERARVFPILEDVSLEERLEIVGPGTGAMRRSVRDRMEDLASRPDMSGWTRLCARRASDELGGTRALDDEAVRLYETTTRLRRADLFGELPGSVLARMAPKLHHESREAGESVFEKGDEGDGMYLILEGRVRVDDEGRELAVLEPGRVFGEFTVLQRAARTASVRALEPARLLRLTREDLHELMRERAGVARALIGVIIRRLRENRAGLRADGDGSASPGELSPSAPEAPG